MTDSLLQTGAVCLHFLGIASLLCLDFEWRPVDGIPVAGHADLVLPLLVGRVAYFGLARGVGAWLVHPHILQTGPIRSLDGAANVGGDISRQRARVHVKIIGAVNKHLIVQAEHLNFSQINIRLDIDSDGALRYVSTVILDINDVGSVFLRIVLNVECVVCIVFDIDRNVIALVISNVDSKISRTSLLAVHSELHRLASLVAILHPFSINFNLVRIGWIIHCDAEGAVRNCDSSIIDTNN